MGEIKRQNRKRKRKSDVLEDDDDWSVRDERELLKKLL